jgi:hypothetical protein
MDLYRYHPEDNKLVPVLMDCRLTDEHFDNFCQQLESKITPDDCFIFVRVDSKKCRLTFLGAPLFMHPEELQRHAYRVSQFFRPLYTGKRKPITH